MIETFFNQKRRWLTNKTTISELFIDGIPEIGASAERECFVLEDKKRDKKIEDITCIPEGTYRVALWPSAHFDQLVPLLVGVPGYEYIEVHPGNFDIDTKGCLLPGQKRVVDAVESSRAAYGLLYPKIVKAMHVGQVYWRISFEPLEDKRTSTV